MPLTETFSTDLNFLKQFRFLIFRLGPEIIVGSNNLIYGGTRYRILSARMHPDYKRSNRTTLPVSDIGIITLAENVKEVTEFPKRRRRVFNDYETPCKVLGKGRIGYPENNVLSNKLKLGFVKQVSKSVCKRRWWKRIKNTKPAPHVLCMTSNDSATCSGDSGGPLLCEGELTGIVSFGRRCGTGKPDIYVDILHYNDWIDWVINNEK
jgi:trypsin